MFLILQLHVKAYYHMGIAFVLATYLLSCACIFYWGGYQFVAIRAGMDIPDAKALGFMVCVVFMIVLALTVYFFIRSLLGTQDEAVSSAH